MTKSSGWTKGSLYGDQDTFSRKHFKIDRKNGNFVIEDLGSTNGVLLNGKYLAPHKMVPIIPGDMITIGLRTYRFDKLS